MTVVGVAGNVASIIKPNSCRRVLPSSPRLRARAVPFKALFENRGRREGRVRVAPMVRVQQKKHAAEPQVRTGHPALPARWLYGLLRALPGDRLSCPRHQRARRSARLASASGGQDHTASPCAPGCSSARTSHAATRNAHRTPPHARDDRDAPLMARWDGRYVAYLSEKRKMKIAVGVPVTAIMLRSFEKLVFWSGALPEAAGRRVDF